MKKKLFRFFVAVISLLAVVSATACGGGNNSSGNGNGKTLLIVVREAGYGKWLDDIAEAYQNETGTTVTINYDPLIDSQMQYMFVANDPQYDLYFCNNSAYLYKWTSKGYLYPITGIEDRVAD